MWLYTHKHVCFRQWKYHWTCKQNYLDDEPNNFDDNKSLNLIIQNKDEQKDFKDIKKLIMSKKYKNIENDEMQFSCKEGDTIFSSNLGPNCHWQPVHEGVWYPCNLCNYKAKQRLCSSTIY